MSERVKRKTRGLAFLQKLIKNKEFIFLCLPAVVMVLIFAYLPMCGLYIGFTDYSIKGGIFGSEFVGFRWFKEFFQSIYAWRIIRNTMLLSLCGVIYVFPIPIIYALFLNEVTNKPFKKIVQTISYMPHFISNVVLVGLLNTIFSSNNDGVVNSILMSFKIVDSPINFFYEPNWFRPIYIIGEIWKSYGWGSIIYLATISSIDTALYEAAELDGAGRFKKMWHVTLPGLSNIIMIQLILRVGGIMSVGFERIVLMYNPAVYETADVISTFVYRRGILDGSLGYGAAVGFFNSVINFILVVICNKISNKVSEVGIW